MEKGQKNNILKPIKQPPSSGQASKNEKQQKITGTNHDAINFNSLDSLEPYKASKQNRKNLYRETDTRFLSDLKKIIKLRSNKYLEIIKNQKVELTGKQYDELDYRARIHGKANSINENSKLNFENIHKIDRCNCGCKKGKGKPISLFEDQQKVKALGPGVLLQFLFTKAAAAMLLPIIIIYCLFALTTNIIGTEANLDQSCKEDLYCKFKQIVSDENKQVGHYFIEIQNWLGLAFCVFWVLSTKVLKIFGQERNRIIDQKLKTASDTAIKVQNLPRENYEQKEVIAHLQELWRRQIKKEEERLKGLRTKDDKNSTILEFSDRNNYELKMKSIQIIYNMEFSRKMSDEIFMLAESVYSFLQSQDGSEEGKSLVANHEQYMKVKEKLLESYELFKDLRKRFLNDPEFRKKLSTTCCIIEFESEKVLKSVLRFFGGQKMGLIKQLQLRIKNCLTPNDRSVLFKKKVLKIQRAPQPSDILWINCEQPESLFRKFWIFSVTCFIMSISFAIIFGLERLKIFIKRNPTLITADILTTLINYGTSVALQIINSVFWSIMSTLLEKEYNHTKTEKIISLMNRVLVLTSVNIIVLPILSNYATYKIYGDSIVYGNEGLSGLCIDYHITSIGATIKKLFSFSAIVRTIVISWRWARHKMIWYYCKDPAHIDYKKGDPEVNRFYEGDEFDIAENYIFIISSILHAAFFCKLQPIILILITFNICLFFFVNKVKIFRLCKIPDMTDYLVFDTSIWLLSLVPLYYGAGTIAISYLQQVQNPSYPFSMFASIASFLSILVGIFGIANPKGVLNKMLRAIFNKCNCIDIAQLMGGQEVDEVDFTANSTEEILSEIINQEKKKKLNNRIESYYSSSNSLSLLGFEKILKGEDNKSSFKELKTFCESFFRKTIVSNQVLVRSIMSSYAQGKIEMEENQAQEKQMEIYQNEEGR